MRKLLFCLVIPAVFAFPAAATAGELKLSIKDGLVTLMAQDVPLSMVMAEWARVGQTRVVNGEKILTPITLQLVDVPERRALDIILRSASGYMLAERPGPVANASVFDRILILPTSRPPANSPVSAPPPAFNQRPIQVQPMPDMEEPMANQPPPGPAPMPPANLPNMPNMQPQTQPGQPGQPGGPLTAPRPGPLPQPQQPVPFGAPPKPPGGGGGGGGSQR
ncbi:MAG TPA: hypothetical protein VM493_12685 [Vicinamibacterales bacterium]|nr:hypothetical protein [Vicinamibacterales bacterium]